MISHVSCASVTVLIYCKQIPCTLHLATCLQATGGSYVICYYTRCQVDQACFITESDNTKIAAIVKILHAWIPSKKRKLEVKRNYNESIIKVNINLLLYQNLIHLKLLQEIQKLKDTLQNLKERKQLQGEEMSVCPSKLQCSPAFPQLNGFAASKLLAVVLRDYIPALHPTVTSLKTGPPPHIYQLHTQ